MPLLREQLYSGAAHRLKVRGSVSSPARSSPTNVRASRMDPSNSAPSPGSWNRRRIVRSSLSPLIENSLVSAVSLRFPWPLSRPAVDSTRSIRQSSPAFGAGACVADDSPCQTPSILGSAAASRGEREGLHAISPRPRSKRPTTPRPGPAAGAPQAEARRSRRTGSAPGSGAIDQG